MEGLHRMNCFLKAFAIAIVIVGVVGSNKAEAQAEAEAMAFVGGKSAVEGHENNMEIEELGRFAIDQHNTQQNEIGKGGLSFRRVVKAEEQVVAGMMYHLTIEATQKDGEAENPPKLYEAKVWVKEWENFKNLEEFKPSPLVSPN
ncbi:cystatin domain-containing protein [Acinetobacter baumannii]|uniref:cystatin domain-containing protein n=1 Tax=Acinetobacter baumannii TaxID=470 RepID=UPI000D0B8F6F|nr:cystatin domain-containing protein [Acinetobacter baumannii]PSE25186.1 hypothetical protein C7G59_19070 [Acinetobacter baumannii]